MELITLAKDDPEFSSFLMGTFSPTHRALPEETFHPQTPRERVTFRLVPIDKVKAPAWWMIYIKSCRPELAGLTLGPAVAAWLNQHDRLADWSRWPSWFALLGIFFLHTAVFLLNDVQDHIRGIDRQNRRRGSQVIQKGWTSAAEMKKWSAVNFALALVFGLPAVIHSPGGLFVVCLAALVSLFVVVQNVGTRWGLSDLALALLFGPLLTAGISLASFGHTNIRDLYVGIAFGSLTLWVLQARQFESLFRTRPEAFRTFLAFQSFDRARRIAIGEGLVMLGIQFAMAWMLELPFTYLGVLPLAAAPLVAAGHRLYKSASPLSSSLVDSDSWALGAHAALTAWWICVLGVAWLV